MPTDYKRCEETGWRQCNRDAFEACVICGSEMCEPCYKKLRVYTGGGFVPTCSKPSCQRLVAISANYAGTVAANEGWHAEVAR